MIDNIIVTTKPKALWALRFLLVLSLLLVPQLLFPHRAFAATSGSDGFNRADGGLGASWTAIADGGMAIASQQVTGTVGVLTGDTWTAGSFTSDQYSQVQVTSTQLTGGQWVGAAVRAQNGGRSAYVGIYYWNSGSPVLELFKRTGTNNWTQLGGAYSSGPLAAGTQLEVAAVGSTISFWQNGVKRISVTDSTFTGGAPGMMAYGNATADNWAGGNAGSFTVGGTVSGLSGTVVLQDNGADDLSVSANGSFTFATPLASGAPYSVTVKTNPSGQTCTVSNGTGTVGSANVTSVTVSCSNTATFTIGGTVSGLSGTVVLQDNGADDLSVSANGSFTFATPLASGAPYSVTVKTNPSGQTCTVSNGTGTVGSANVTSVTVSCTANTATSGSDGFNRADGGLGASWTAIADGGMAIASQQVTGTVGVLTGDTWTAGSFTSDQYSQVQVTSTQLTGGQWVGAAVRAQNGGRSAYVGIYYWNSGSPVLELFKRTGTNNWTQLGGAYSSGPLAAGTQLEVAAVGSTISFWQNGVKRISVTDSTFTGGAPGMMAYGNATADNWAGGNAGSFTVGGTVSGLSGTVVLQDNGADDLSVSANGSFTFATPLASGAPYSVTVKTNPSGQTCTVSNGTGTVGSANVTSVTVSCSNTATFTIGGTVSGLSGTVVLQDNGADDLSVSANGSFTFATPLASGAPYSVTVKTNPSGQTCTVSNGTGTVGSANVTSVTVSCTANTATSGSDGFNRADGGLGASWTAIADGGMAIASQQVTGTVGVLTGDTWTAGSFTSDQYSQVQVTSTQLTGGQWVGAAVRAQNGGRSAYVGIYYWNSGSPVLELFKRTGTNNWTQLGGAYSSGPLAAGTQLEVAAVGSTISFWQNGVKRISVTDSTFTGGAPGMMAYGNATADNWAGGNAGSFTVGGTVSGLSGTVVLQDNGADDLSVSANGSFTFATPLASGAPYSVTVKTNPSGQTCTVSNGTGTVGSANVTSVAVSCTASTGGSFTVGGTVSGLSGTVVLQDNGADDLSVSANGSFTFATPLASGAPYSVTVKTNPSGQTCTVSNGTGTVGSANVTSVTVSCSNTATFTIGGTVSGLSGTVVLQDNGADDLSVSANGSFTFATPLASGAPYSVTVKTNPSGQTCTVSNGTGTVGSANVTSVTVSCTANTATSGSDGFNRADGGLGASWTAIADGGMAIASQQVTGTAGVVSGDIRTAETYPGDQYSEVEVTSTQLTGSQWIGPAVRLQNGGQDGYVGLYNWNSGSPVLQLFKRSGGNWTQLGSTYSSGPLAAGTKLRLTVLGNSISFTANGVERIGLTDSTFSSGAPGIMAFGSATVDNWSGSSASFQVNYQSTDAQGVKSYEVLSTDDGYGPQTLRVLTPTNPVAGVAHNFAIVLPVQSGQQNTFGDGLTTLRALGVQDQYNLTIIEPSFAIDPWYADNPNDPNLHYESFITQELVPWIKQHLSTTGSEQIWLIGFSKSGIGGQDLILKHPDLFTLAASWDLPANMSSYDLFGSNSASNYGTDANFQANYRLTAAFVDVHKGPFLINNRIWIGGYNLFPTDDSDYNNLLASEAIVHSHVSQQYSAHSWDSGWVPAAMAALYQDSVNLH